MQPDSSSAIGFMPLILIVEDSRTQAAVLRHLLSSSGFEVMVATNGVEATEMARARRPALVISDIIMPAMDGYVMCAALKSQPDLREVPVVLLTSLSDATDIVKGLQVGADFYLTKPYDPPYLVAMVKSILAQKFVDEGTPEAMEIEVAGECYSIQAGRRQMLNLLLSTYGNAVIQNRALLKAQNELQSLNAQLVAQRQQIESHQRELLEANHLLQAQALRDGMTGLFNFRAFKGRLNEEVARSRRHEMPLSLMLLDVDRFKQFNDSFGHPAGDEVLRQVARILENQARSGDFVARYGGEEFVVLLPATSGEAAARVGERVRRAIESETWSLRPITASIGIATTLADDAEATVLLARADAALYVAKSEGRNRVATGAALK